MAGPTPNPSQQSRSLRFCLLSASFTTKAPLAPEKADRKGGSSLYIPALDGLRFVAFFLVFFHHLRAPPPNQILTFLHQYGWAGVEVFFVISSYLCFSLLKAEQQKTGAINTRYFLARRFLRIYPLLIFFTIFIALISYKKIEITPYVFRALGLFLSIDNLVIWFDYYNISVPYSAHLWTLSFEFQIYLLIPFAFLGYIALGQRRFLWLIGALWMISLLARAIAIAIDLPHPIIWVTPFFRPDSVLLGIVLSLGVTSRMKSALVIILGATAIALLLMGPNVDVIGPWSLALYPLVAIIGGNCLWLTLYWRPASNLLGAKPIRYLGKISFGLYVYHLWTINLGRKVVKALPGWTEYGPYAQFTVTLIITLAITVAVSTISYYVIERPFLKRKEAMAALQTRPI